MSVPIERPGKKNPQLRTRVPTLPPVPRSRAALGLTAAAAEGRFMLQHCGECGAVQYPPRDACGKCLSGDLRWQDTDPAGQVIAESTVRVSTAPYFRERGDWRIGTVRLAVGVSVMAYLHGDVEQAGPVRMTARLDRAGQGVLVAMPPRATPNMEDDKILREMTCDPRHRRVLITDARAPDALALAKAFLDAGATKVFMGESEQWRGHAERAALSALEGVEILPLDVTDTRSVQELAGQIGGKTDILVNNARFIRPGGLFARGDVTFARDEMEVNYFGLMRLAQVFGPAMAGRGADGVNNAVAWVNLLSVHALSNLPQIGPFAASQAAALSLSQALRAEVHGGGLRVMNVFSGPTEDAWHQPLPPPKVQPKALARAVISGLRGGLEEVAVGDVAKDMLARWREDPKVLEYELTRMGGGDA